MILCNQLSRKIYRVGKIKRDDDQYYFGFRTHDMEKWIIRTKKENDLRQIYEIILHVKEFTLVTIDKDSKQLVLCFNKKTDCPISTDVLVPYRNGINMEKKHQIPLRVYQRK